MNISFEIPDKVSGLLTITVEEADIKDGVEKSLKDYRRRANFPGFRPGMTPMSLVKKRFGASARMDVLNHFVSEQLNKYIQDNKINMLGNPLPSEKQEPVDIEKDAPYVFMFDIAVSPEFEIKLDGKDKLPYYNIVADDKLIDEQVDMYAGQMGTRVNVDAYDAEQRDMLKGDLRELDAEGNTKEGGITVEGAVLMPQYMHVDEQKKLFEGAKLGDIITFNPRKAYPDGDAEISALLKIDKEVAHDLQSDFSLQVTEISRFQKAEVNQEMFDQVFGKDTVKDEKAFREKIAEGLKPQLEDNSNYKFLSDLREYALKKVGTLTFPESILKRMMLQNAKDEKATIDDKEYEEGIKYLTWQLVRSRLAKDNNVQIDDADVKREAKEAARMQFAQYGMNNIPDEYLEKYATEMLEKDKDKSRYIEAAVDNKLVSVIKTVVKLNSKDVSLDEFNKMMKGE